MKRVLSFEVNAKGWVETRAIQAVIDLAEDGDEIIFESAKQTDGKEYIIEGSPLVINRSISIRGDSPNVKILQRSPTMPVLLIEPTSDFQTFIIENLVLESGSSGISLSSSFNISPQSQISNVKITGHANRGINIDAPELIFKINNIFIDGGQYGIYASSSAVHSNFLLKNSTIQSASSAGVLIHRNSTSDIGNKLVKNVELLNNNVGFDLKNVTVSGSAIFYEGNSSNVVTSSATLAIIAWGGGGGGAPSIHGTNHLSGGLDPIPVATSSSSGLMSAQDKAKSDATSPYVLLLKPSGTVSAGTYNDWQSLYAFYSTLGDAPCKLLFDSSLLGGSPILIPSGTYEINRATSFAASSYAGGVTGLLFSGATFSRFNEVTALNLINTGSTPVLTISGSEFGEVSSFQGNAFIQALGSAPVIKIKTSTVIAGNGTFTILSGNYQAVELEYPGAGSPVGCVLAAGVGYQVQPNSIRTAGINELAYFILITLVDATSTISLDQPSYSSVAGSLNSLASSYTRDRDPYNGEVNDNFNSGSFPQETGVLTIDSSGGPISGSLPGYSAHLVKGTTATYKKVSSDSNEIKIFIADGSGDTIEGLTSGSMSEPGSLRSYYNLGDGRWILKNSIK